MQEEPTGSVVTAKEWWRLETTPGESVDDIQAQFRVRFESAGSPAGAALFCNHVLLERTTLFLTPQAAILAEDLLRTHGAVPCEAPTEGIFLVGDVADRYLLTVPTLSAPTAEPSVAL